MCMVTLGNHDSQLEFGKARPIWDEEQALPASTELFVGSLNNLISTTQWLHWEGRCGLEL